MVILSRMELALSLGDTPKPFSFLDKPQKMVSSSGGGRDLGFCMGMGKGSTATTAAADTDNQEEERRGSSDPPVQLDLLPFSPVPRSQNAPQLSFSWLTQNRT